MKSSSHTSIETTTGASYTSDHFTHLNFSDWPEHVNAYMYLTVKYTVYQSGHFDYAYEYTFLPDMKIKEVFVTYALQGGYTTQVATYYESRYREIMGFYPVVAYPDPSNSKVGKMRIVRVGAAPFFMSTWSYTLVNDQTIILEATTGSKTVVMTYVSPVIP